jgi:GxxExxY protein
MATSRKTREELNRTTGVVVDSSIKVHRRLGPGLLESAYQACLVYELVSRGLSVRSQVEVPIEYDGVLIDAGYRMDLLVDDEVIVELKTVTKLLPVHQAQLMSYLRLSDRRVGLLINFYVFQLRDGIKRLVN